MKTYRAGGAGGNRSFCFVISGFWTLATFILRQAVSTKHEHEAVAKKTGLTFRSDSSTFRRLKKL
jgi:hypothetical protein